jgi:hypothetical protein
MPAKTVSLIEFLKEMEAFTRPTAKRDPNIFVYQGVAFDLRGKYKWLKGYDDATKGFICHGLLSND